MGGGTEKVHEAFLCLGLGIPRIKAMKLDSGKTVLTSFV